MRKFYPIIISLLLLTSCGEYNKVLKSTDANVKFEYAKKAFEKGKYGQACTLLSEIVTVMKGTEHAEEALYLLGLSHFENKDYISSGAYFKTYYTHYPKGKYAELARFYSGYGYYLDSPEPQLDQTTTHKAIEELQNFLDYFPKSDKVSIAQNAIFELQDKLVLKELQNAVLYYNLGTYLGNNYESAVITAQNAIKEYPYSKYKEQLQMLILKSRYQEAVLSVDEKKEDRFRIVIDEYYSFINDYPESESRQEADHIFKIAGKYVKD
ncbi:MAG: outer membrane protein assembly factor BamD [Bacteroidales bacterium]|nr:outer membrane protein assembly factor BamD [Bacteroidales bacterium]MDD6131228.1 outer membrane protein assembly factor BamD [Bacteroidales bacterium]MDD6852352.1 outer membrane protein assembly factor BamD [Bacteroidales bacterium]MDD7404713.1 outer membrane protein assembly factor BamD [Bacteroidales bacterium]MDY2931966.1 outer membrane protein assembly factor BamD [Muribaculaceae bacterium]